MSSLPLFVISALLLFFSASATEQDSLLLRNATATPKVTSSSLTLCPPLGFDARATLDIDSYISELWYPQFAAPVIYAQSQSYCSVVQYTRDDRVTLFGRNKPRILVRNRGLDGSIDGDLNDARIRAFIPRPRLAPAKIKVAGLQFFTQRTNYWVIAAGTYDELVSGESSNSEVYDWAVISGGRPFRRTLSNKCVAGFGRFDTRGLWMFARDPIPPEGVHEAITALVDEMGLDTSLWIPVIHEGCNYDFLDG